MDHQINWLQLSPNLLKFVEKKGRRGQRPRFGDHVEILTTLSINESEKGIQQLQIGYGLSELSRLLDASALSMDEDEVSKFRAQLSSGEDINYEVNLTRIVSQLPHVYQWESSQLLSTIKHFKEQGVALYREKDIVNSFHAFSRALKLAIPVEVKYNQEAASPNAQEVCQSKTEILGLIASLYNNLSACHLEQKNFSQVVELCDQAMKRTPNDVKAIFRKSSALIELHNYAAASEFLVRGLQLDPNNKALQNLKLKTSNALKQQDKMMAEGMKKFFQ